MTTFNWTISAVERVVNLNELQDVIKTVHWRYRGTDEYETTAETYGATSISDPNPEEFTPFDGVTELDVIGWLENILGEINEETQTSQLDNMKNSIEHQIQLLTNPVTIIGPLFSEPTTEVVLDNSLITNDATALE